MEVRWRPFQLDANASMEGIPKRDAYEAKFGKERAAKILSDDSPLAQRFQAEGIPLNHDGLTGNTFDAHRLALHAERVGGLALQNKLMEELFDEYFSKGHFVGSRDVLRAVAARVGVPQAEPLLDADDTLAEDLRTELKDAHRGVRGVPHFVVDGRLHFSGAQPTQLWTELLQEVASGDA